MFGLINHLHARTAERRVERVLGHLGSAACSAAIVVVFVQLAIDNPAALGLIAGCLISVGALRLAFLRSRRAPSANTA